MSKRPTAFRMQKTDPNVRQLERQSALQLKQLNQILDRVRTEERTAAALEIARINRDAALWVIVEHERSQFERAVLAISLISHKESGQRRIEELKLAGEEFGKIYNRFIYTLIEADHLLMEPTQTLDRVQSEYKRWQRAIAALLAGDNGKAVEAAAADYLNGSIFLERREFGGLKTVVATEYIAQRSRELRNDPRFRDDHAIVQFMIQAIEAIPEQERSDVQQQALTRMQGWKYERRGRTLSNLLSRLE